MFVIIVASSSISFVIPQTTNFSRVGLDLPCMYHPSMHRVQKLAVQAAARAAVRVKAIGSLFVNIGDQMHPMSVAAANSPTTDHAAAPVCDRQGCTDNSRCLCSACNIAQYCGKRCQVEGFGRHHASCRTSTPGLGPEPIAVSTRLFIRHMVKQCGSVDPPVSVALRVWRQLVVKTHIVVHSLLIYAQLKDDPSKVVFVKCDHCAKTHTLHLSMTLSSIKKLQTARDCSRGYRGCTGLIYEHTNLLRRFPAYMTLADCGVQPGRTLHCVLWSAKGGAARKRKRVALRQDTVQPHNSRRCQGLAAAVPSIKELFDRDGNLIVTAR
jgi:hypothetical protein